MIRLVRAELGRSRSRLLVWIALLATLAVTAMVALSVYSSTVPPSATELAQQTQFFEENLKDWELNHVQQYQDCLTSQADDREAMDDPAIDYGCESLKKAPTLDDWLYTQTASDVAPYTFSGFLQVLLGGTFVIGASLLAAEIATGNLGLWLTFAPRRGAVLAAKLVAVAVTSLLYAIVGAAAGIAGIAGAAAINGALDLTSQQWEDLTLMAVRAILLAVATGVVGATLGVLLRHTAAALGAAFGYLLVFEAMFGMGAGKIQQWLLLNNVTAVIEGRKELYWTECKADPTTGIERCTEVNMVLTQADSALYLGLLAALLVLVAWLVFRRRDVS